MQQFHAGHFLAALGYLDAVTDQDLRAIDTQRVREQFEHRLCPRRRASIKTYGAAMKALEQLVVEARLSLKRAHDAGYTRQFGAHSQAGYRRGKAN